VTLATSHLVEETLVPRSRETSAHHRLSAFLLALAVCLQPLAAWAGDPYIRDNVGDTGMEQNPYTGNYWLSPDIWVRNTPDPNYDPAPYPIGSPTWTPQTHEDAEYDDPKTGFPAYVYVRVRNRGATATTGTERLRVYWAKASTGLSWPTQWVDYMDNSCGPTELHGMEITKTRKNASTVSGTERSDYVTALLDIDANAALQFSDGTQYWDKQNTIHSSGGALHGNHGFLPWHREYLNRLEVLLRESDPLLTLLYWDWTTNPLTFNGVNLFSTSFMGASSGTVGAPLTPLQPPTLSRNVGFWPFSPDSDATLLGLSTYPTFRSDLEGVPNHNSVHGYIGGPGGQISSVPTAASDPFFFFLHGNVDRLWAQWQRDPSQVGRLDPATTYGTAATSTGITNDMNPWAGSLSPWNTPTWEALKNGTHPSVVSPPYYDTAPLTVPVLQPNEEVIVQVPWFPPDPADFSCFGDSGHFCLLARIETSTSMPYGMTFPEGASVGANAKANNNIAWKNIAVVDDFARLRFLIPEIVRNTFSHAALVRLRFDVPDYDHSYWDHGEVRVTLPRAVGRRVVGGVLEYRGETEVGPEYAVPQPGAYVDLQLEAKESFPIRLGFDYPQGTPEQQRRVPFDVDLVQLEVTGGGEKVMGGQRFTLDLSQLTLVDEGSEWRVTDAQPQPGWTGVGYDDTGWDRARAPFARPGDDAVRTVYFRHTFTADSPDAYTDGRLRLLADDGAAVYLNGQEIYRHGLAAGTLDAETAADTEAKGVEEGVYWHKPLELRPYLRAGENVLAVEVHQGTDPDLGFDLELLAGRTFDNLPPEVAVVTPGDGAQVLVGDPISVRVEALDQDGQVSSVELLVDGQSVASQSAAPLDTVISGLTPGVHRLEARAVDDSGATARHLSRLTVHPSLPPVVTITSPAQHAMLAEGEPVRVTAAVLSSPSAPVARVDLFVKEGGSFATGLDLVEDPNYPAVATATKPPYELDLSGLPAGMHMFQVSATDAKGNVGASTHVMVMVHPSKAVACERRDVDGGCMSLRPAGDQDGDGIENRLDFCPDSVLERPSAEGWTAARRGVQGFELVAPGGEDGVRARSVEDYGDLGGCTCVQMARSLGMELRAGMGCDAATLERFRQRLVR
jgi:hypothetical protein